jgi:translation initiation factor IF-2
MTMSTQRPKNIAELAKQTGLEAEALIAMLDSMGVSVASEEDQLSDEMIAIIMGEDSESSEKPEKKKQKTLTLGSKKTTKTPPAPPKIEPKSRILSAEKTKKVKANKVGQTKSAPQKADTKQQPAVEKTLVPADLSEKSVQPLSSQAPKSKSAEPGSDAAPLLAGQSITLKNASTLNDLVEKTGVTLKDLINIAMKSGLMVSRANQRLTNDIVEKLCDSLGASVSFVEADEPEAPQTPEKTSPKKKRKKEQQAEYKKKPRPPVVTIMGHVDHGKTTLLDTIRSLKEKVADKEAGKITQHIGAYHVTHKKGAITFIDTPGHEAFSAMRYRGAQVTDIVILVVAADDSVMPQTIEAIEHARQAEVPIVVAINKIDRDNADPNRVTTELAQHDITLESWGGATLSQNISAKTGEGVDSLLDAVLLQAEMLELNAYAEGLAEGVVIESKLDRGRGPVATILVQSGQLKTGQNIFVGRQQGKIRAMLDDQGKKLKEAGPAIPVEILGLSGVPSSGDAFKIFESEKAIKEEIKQQSIAMQSKEIMDADMLQSLMLQQSSEAGGKIKILNVIIKADSHGSVEAIRDALNKRSSEETKVKVISSKVGGINDSDVRLSMTARAMLIGFHVRTTPEAQALARQFSVKINHYSIIYDLIEDIEALLLGLTAPKYEEIVLGVARIKQVFRSSKYQSIAGCSIEEGSIKKHARARVRRKSDIVFEGQIESIRHLQDTIEEAKKGTECGLAMKKFHEYEEGDLIEMFEKKEIKPVKTNK